MIAFNLHVVDVQTAIPRQHDHTPADQTEILRQSTPVPGLMIDAERALETARVGDGRSELDLARVAFVEGQVRVLGKGSPVGKAVKRGGRAEAVGTQCRQERHSSPDAMAGNEQAL